MCSLAFESPIILLEKIIFGGRTRHETKEAETVTSSSNRVVESASSIGHSTDDLIKTDKGVAATDISSNPDLMANGNGKFSWRF